MISFIIIIFFFLENVFERLHNIQKCVVYAKILSWQDITNADGAVSIIDTLVIRSTNLKPQNKYHTVSTFSTSNKKISSFLSFL
jgi:hypothetical protein